MPLPIANKETIIRVLVYALIFVVYVRVVETLSLFYPSKKIRANPKDIGLTFEDVYLKTEDGVLINAWFMKNNRARSTILILHGNAGNNSDRLEKISYFYKMGLNVLCLDYRGF